MSLFALLFRPILSQTYSSLIMPPQWMIWKYFCTVDLDKLLIFFFKSIIQGSIKTAIT